MFIISCLLSIPSYPLYADAWGPLTHVYLGYQVLDLGAALIPAGIYSIIKEIQNDFLYGNISADIILGRRFQDHDKNPIAGTMHGSCLKREDKPGEGLRLWLPDPSLRRYSCHNLQKSWVPFDIHTRGQAESMVDKKYRTALKRLIRSCREKMTFSWRISLKVFSFPLKHTSAFLKVFSYFRDCLIMHPLQLYWWPFPLWDSSFRNSQFSARIPNRMLELLNNGKDSDVLKKHPLGNIFKKSFLSIQRSPIFQRRALFFC